MSVSCSSPTWVFGQRRDAMRPRAAVHETAPKVGETGVKTGEARRSLTTAATKVGRVKEGSPRSAGCVDSGLEYLIRFAHLSTAQRAALPGDRPGVEVSDGPSGDPSAG